MTLQKLAMYVGALIVASFLAVVATSQLAMQRLKVNGPIYDEITNSKNLIADILPPPKYIIESYLEATLALNDPASVEARTKRLDALRKDYDIRQTFWTQQPLEANLKSGLTDKSHGPAMQFWATLDKTFLPALRAGDLTAAKAAYDELSKAYSAHRSEVDKLVEAANLHIASTEAQAQSDVSTTMVAVWSGTLFMLGLLVGAVMHLLKNVIAPLKAVTGTVLSLAKGDKAGEVPFLDRGDEIGDIAHAVAALKSVSAPKAAAAGAGVSDTMQSKAVRELEELEKSIARHSATAAGKAKKA